jgi:nitroimidazol reductase NimA-like FMN-containing flavoprotein (pyridoxamine 5'-phosphate oxidase superfamily)
MSSAEIEELLALDVPVRLATLDADGVPHVTPLWFLWANDAFHMTSIEDRPHVRRLATDPRAGLVVDVEAAELADGERPNRQVRAIGRAALSADADGHWTRRITHKYLRGPGAAEAAAARASDPRLLIRLVPTRLVAVAST